MRICGIIAEYNPFHSGHRYHVTRARALTGCDCVAAVMAGSFSQRGDAMLLDKWTRTRMALENGVDVVVELPVRFAVGPAERFARGGVAILSALGADAFSFGCECGETERFNRLVDMRADEPDALRRAVKANLKLGMAHPRARGAALAALLNIEEDALTGPNDALAVEYMHANRRARRPMVVYPVVRTAPYHGMEIDDIASASAIRAAWARGDAGALRAMPESSAALLNAYRGCADMARLDEALLIRLRAMNRDDFKALPDAGEGIEMRAMKCAANAHGRESLIEAVKCKRYTRARISRLLTHALLHMTRTETEAAYPEYIRVLGFRKDAVPLLASIGRIAALPMVTDPMRLRGSAEFEIETRATDIWGLATDNPTYRAAGNDYRQKMVIV